MPKNRILACVAFFFALTALVLYVTSFFPHAIRSFLLFVVLNLAFWMIAVTLGRNRGETKVSFRFPKAIQNRLMPLKILLPAFCVANLIPVLVGGTPIQKDSQLLKKTISGTIREVSRDEYLKLEAAEERLFSGFWFSMDIALGLSLWFKETR